MTDLGMMAAVVAAGFAARPEDLSDEQIAYSSMRVIRALFIELEEFINEQEERPENDSDCDAEEQGCCQCSEGCHDDDRISEHESVHTGCCGGRCSDTAGGCGGCSSGGGCSCGEADHYSLTCADCLNFEVIDGGGYCTLQNVLAGDGDSVCEYFAG